MLAAIQKCPSGRLGCDGRGLPPGLDAALERLAPARPATRGSRASSMTRASFHAASKSRGSALSRDSHIAAALRAWAMRGAVPIERVGVVLRAATAGEARMSAM